MYYTLYSHFFLGFRPQATLILTNVQSHATQARSGKLMVQRCTPVRLFCCGVAVDRPSGAVALKTANPAK